MMGSRMRETRRLRFPALPLLPLLLAGCAASRAQYDYSHPTFLREAYKSGPHLKLCVKWLPDENNKSALTRRAGWYKGKLVEASTFQEALAKGCDVLVTENVAGQSYASSVYTGNLLVGVPNLRGSDELNLSASGYDIATALAPGFTGYDQVVAERKAYREKQKAAGAPGKP
jgi:hypothetical protein